jgi:Ser/Thr protein kinase RdoA (MazF antagonist)
VLLAGGVPCAPPVPTRQGQPWVRFETRLVEVEVYVDYDAVMDSWQRLEVGMALLARVHNLLRELEVGEEGRRPRFANHLEPADVASSVRRGIERIRGWEPTPADHRLAAVVEELAELVTQAEAGLVSWLPRQLVHGDFWDNNVGSATGGRCCWPTSTSWGSGPVSTTWHSRCGVPAATSAPMATRRKIVPGRASLRACASRRSWAAAWRLSQR